MLSADKASIFLTISILFLFGNPYSGRAEVNATANTTAANLTAGADENKNFAGEFYGVKVPLENYYFVRNAVILFGNKWGAQPQNAKEREELTWDQLLLSYVAFSQNITVSQEEVDGEISQSLRAENVGFDWKKDKDAYTKWVEVKTHESPALFENQVRHLLQIDRLRSRVMDSIKPEVTDKEGHARFLNENSSLSLELIRFDEQKDADEFYKKASGNNAFWEKEKKKRPQDFKAPGLVSLAFLADIWKIPEDAINKMMQKSTGEIYPPRPIYKGYGVFKVLEKKFADESAYQPAKDSYDEAVRKGKQYEGMNEWFKGLKQQANIKIYSNEGGQK